MNVLGLNAFAKTISPQLQGLLQLLLLLLLLLL